MRGRARCICLVIAMAKREEERERGQGKLEVKDKEFVYASGDTKNNYKVLSRVLFGGVNERELLGR
jgi:hypothetical protein